MTEQQVPRLVNAEGIPTPRADEFVAQLSVEYGPEYTTAFIDAVQAEDSEDHPGREVVLDAAIAVLVSAGWTFEQSRDIARDHQRFVYAVIQDDLQARVDGGGVLKTPRRPDGGESA